MKKYYIHLGLITSALLFLIILTSLKESRQKEIPKDLAGPAILHDDEALQLMASLCFSCHNPDMSTPHEQRLAPPMFKVREHYYNDNVSRSDFIAKVSAFVQNPSKEASRMPGAIRNFGLMPKPAFKEADVKKIAAYMFDNDLSSEAWREQMEKLQNKK